MAPTEIEYAGNTQTRCHEFSKTRYDIEETKEEDLLGLQ
jgi:hypothetical protein